MNSPQQCHHDPKKSNKTKYNIFFFVGIPVSVCGIIGEIGEESLVDVENPRVLPVAAERHTPRELLRLFGDHFEVDRVPLPGHVLLHVLRAFLRNRPPRAQVVRLPRHAPRAAPQPRLELRVLHDQRPREHAVESGAYGIGIGIGIGIGEGKRDEE